MSVQDNDLGWKRIKQEMQRASRREVVVGVLSGEKNGDGASIAEYAAHNEYGTKNGVPSRPFMSTSFDENLVAINRDFEKQTQAVIEGKRTADGALTIIGQKHADRIKNTITTRNFLPKLADSTVAMKKGSTKTLVDTGAMTNAIQISVRDRE